MQVYNVNLKDPSGPSGENDETINCPFLNTWSDTDGYCEYECRHPNITNELLCLTRGPRGGIIAKEAPEACPLRAEPITIHRKCKENHTLGEGLLRACLKEHGKKDNA